jgi:2-dehydro-3-deoxyphosphogluconate aldolase/(4S)-4-hydroxy-2-oxoglutarate aldolase
VLNVDEAIRAAEVGAQFIVSPIIRETTMEAALDRGLAVVPGAASPTEIDRAWNAGATAVKVFPIHQLGGVPYLNAILSPLRKPALVPTGGVTAESTPDYLAAGAVAVGAGADLFSVSDFANGGSAAIAANAKAWVEAAT